MSSLVYRTDIDGLRAIAVLFVVLFHAFPSVFPGGYIGVDVFFVISGFLITSIILSDIHLSQFSFRNFYIKRIKRIFPALIIFLAFFIFFGFYVLFDDEYASFAKHVFSSALFFNNFTLIHEAGYFDKISDLKPLLHLWSLGVEEQFYILWPLLIVGLSLKKIPVNIGIIILVIASFIINLLRAKYHGTDAFYSPQSRFWELGLGGLLAYYGVSLSSFKYSSVVGLLGFLCLCVGFFAYNQQLYYPYWYALLPTVSAICLIGFPGVVNQKILSYPKLMFIGRISYPLYLWHWGLLSFARIIYDGKITNALALVLVILSLILSWFTYRFIETPIRRIKDSSQENQIALILLIGLLGIGMLGNLIVEKQGLIQRKFVVEKAKYDQDLKGFGNYKEKVIKCSYLGSKDQVNNNCFKSISGKADIAIWGDSHAEHLFPGLMANDLKHNWLLLERSNCPPIIGVKAYWQGNKDHCLKTNKQIMNTIINQISIKTVVLSSLGVFYMSDVGHDAEHIGKYSPINFHLEIPEYQGLKKDEVFLKGLESSIMALLQAHKHVVIVEDIPMLPFMPTACIKRPLRYRSISCELHKQTLLQYQAKYHQMLLSLKQKYPEISLFNAFETICKKRTCPVIQNHHLMYRDSHHLSTYGSQVVAKALIEQEFS